DVDPAVRPLCTIVSADFNGGYESTDQFGIRLHRHRAVVGGLLPGDDPKPGLRGVHPVVGGAHASAGTGDDLPADRRDVRMAVRPVEPRTVPVVPGHLPHRADSHGG